VLVDRMLVDRVLVDGTLVGSAGDAPGPDNPALIPAIVSCDWEWHVQIRLTMVMVFPSVFRLSCRLIRLFPARPPPVRARIR